MIGQYKNKELLMQWRMNKSVPRFIIIEGDEGSGRLTFAKLIIKTLNATGIICESNIDSVRTAIENAYNVSSTTCYIFRDVDDMSTAAKNSMLKLVEEPPNNAYFIMTLKSIDNMLGTIKSRGVLIKMQPYTHNQLVDIAGKEVSEYLRTPGQVLQEESYNIPEIETTVNNIIVALQNKSGLNLLKETTKLQAKSTEEGKLDVLLTLIIFERKLLENYNMLTSEILGYISTCKNELKNNSVNKKASFESMLIKILEELKNGTEIS